MSDVIDRESLLIYLNDLRTMETIVYESDKKITEIKNKKEDFRKNYLSKKSLVPVKPSKPEPPKKNNLTYVLLCSTVVFLIAAIACLAIGGFIGILLFICCLIFGGLCLMCSSGYKSEYKEACIKYNDLVNKYENGTKEYEKKLKEYNRKLDEEAKIFENKTANSDNSIKSINEEKNYINQKLIESYDINIIPLQFRNIRGVYYLYDYLSTSNQSLSEALMQCNLEAIKEKLDNVIQLQSKAIIQQAKANAALYEQNQKILETAQATMNNTAVAAKYAQISAINSELSLKLQNKQLAYQSADFWLK